MRAATSSIKNITNATFFTRILNQVVFHTQTTYVYRHSSLFFSKIYTPLIQARLSDKNLQMSDFSFTFSLLLSNASFLRTMRYPSRDRCKSYNSLSFYQQKRPLHLFVDHLLFPLKMNCTDFFSNVRLMQ